MKYISLESIEKARLRILPDSFQAESTDVTPEEKAYIDGWNECIDALKHLGTESIDMFGEVFADAMQTLIDPIIHKTTVAEIKGSADNLDDEFLQALGGGQAEPADDVGYPDCEDCRISGLLTDD